VSTDNGDPVVLDQEGRTPRGECGHCGSRFPEEDSFTFRGFHFCTECVSSLASWFLDGGMAEDPDMFGYVVPDEV
jgi:hypothetical protein